MAIESLAELSTLDQARQFRLKAGSLMERLKHPAARLAAGFDERRYLFSNKDVAQEVQQGKFASGFDHWLRYGWSEDRPGDPAEPVSDRRFAIPELQSRALGFNIYGHLSTPSGGGGLARRVSQAVEHLGLPVNGIDVLPFWKGMHPSGGSHSATPYRVNLFILQLNGFEQFLRLAGTKIFEGAYNIGFWFWELPAPHPYWCRFFRYFDEIWTGSQFCRETFQCLTNLPVVVIPPPIEGFEQQATHSREHFGFPADVFVFTSVFDIGSYVTRKNPFCLIRAFRREFGDSPRVALFIKVWNSKSDTESLRALELAVEGAPNIRIFDGVFSDAEMASLHRHGDCLVSPHRSEGFGLNMAESMYFGNPVIATGYSANLDFMNDENGYLIDYHLAALTQAEGPYWEGGVWAEPSEDHLCQLMRRVVENPAERARKGEAARNAIRAKHSLPAVARAIGARLDEIGLLSPDLSTLELHRHPESARMFSTSMDDRTFRKVLEVEPRFGISITMAVSAGLDEASLRRSINSVRAQSYPLWDLSIVEDGSATPEVRLLLQSWRGRDDRMRILLDCADAAQKAVEISMYAYLIVLEPGSVLRSSALLDSVRTPSTLLSKQEFYRNLHATSRS